MCWPCEECNLTVRLENDRHIQTARSVSRRSFDNTSILLRKQQEGAKAYTEVTNFVQELFQNLTCALKTSAAPRPGIMAAAKGMTPFDPGGLWFMSRVWTQITGRNLDWLRSLVVKIENFFTLGGVGKYRSKLLRECL